MNADTTTAAATALDASTPNAAIRLDIDGMSCGHCVAAVTTALANLPGVSIERVAVGSAVVTVAAADAADARRSGAVLVNAVRAAGFVARVAG